MLPTRGEGGEDKPWTEGKHILTSGTGEELLGRSHLHLAKAFECSDTPLPAALFSSESEPALNPSWQSPPLVKKNKNEKKIWK